MQEPKRIISSRVAARRIGISRPALAKYIRREIIVPDFVSDTGCFFEPARIPQLKQAISDNRNRNWRHVTASARGALTPMAA
jgi:hypothetical protein